MADEIQAQLEASFRREGALAGVLKAVAAGGDLADLLHEIALRSAELTGADVGAVFFDRGEHVDFFANSPLMEEPTITHDVIDGGPVVTNVLRDRR